jgi:hypothetical protein
VGSAQLLEVAAGSGGVVSKRRHLLFEELSLFDGEDTALLLSQDPTLLVFFSTSDAFGLGSRLQQEKG